MLSIVEIGVAKFLNLINNNVIENYGLGSIRSIALNDLMNKVRSEYPDVKFYWDGCDWIAEIPEVKYRIKCFKFISMEYYRCNLEIYK